MTTNDPTAQTLEQLGVKTPEAVGETFAEVCQRFDDQSSLHSSNRENWQIFVVQWTGRKSGVLSQITNNWLKTASPELKPAVGQELNKLKAHVESAIAERQRSMDAASEQSAAARDKIDLSLPGIERSFGTRHLIRQTLEELQQIFIAIGFSVVQGPEIETPYYNFEALNIPEHHPARDNMDTFYI
jgi:phenylalanyl-tRNA synthetase alpha chain